MRKSPEPIENKIYKNGVSGTRPHLFGGDEGGAFAAVEEEAGREVAAAVQVGVVNLQTGGECFPA